MCATQKKTEFLTSLSWRPEHFRMHMNEPYSAHGMGLFWAPSIYTRIWPWSEIASSSPFSASPSISSFSFSSVSKWLFRRRMWHLTVHWSLGSRLSAFPPIDLLTLSSSLVDLLASFFLRLDRVDNVIQVGFVSCCAVHIFVVVVAIICCLCCEGMSLWV